VFNERYTLDVLFSCLKVIHAKPIAFTFATATKKLVSDVYEEYDTIADANELSTPYISAIYGKSKHHFMRIIGCLWALEVALEVLKSIEVLPTEKDAFISAVLTKYATLKEPTEVTIEVVGVAKMVNSYFIEHKLIMSELERDEAGEYKFVKKAALVKNSKLTPGCNTVTKSPAPASLEQRILTTSGPIVFLTPLSASHLAKKDSFKNSCVYLESKGLGAYGKFPVDENSSRNASGFKKTALHEKSSAQELLMTNALFDFGVSLEVYAETFSKPNVILKTTPRAVAKTTKDTSSSKRISTLVSLDNIAQAEKLARTEASSSDEEADAE